MIPEVRDVQNRQEGAFKSFALETLQRNFVAIRNRKSVDAVHLLPHWIEFLDNPPRLRQLAHTVQPTVFLLSADAPQT